MGINMIIQTICYAEPASACLLSRIWSQSRTHPLPLPQSYRLLCETQTLQLHPSKTPAVLGESVIVRGVQVGTVKRTFRMPAHSIYSTQRQHGLLSDHFAFFVHRPTYRSAPNVGSFTRSSNRTGPRLCCCGCCPWCPWCFWF